VSKYLYLSLMPESLIASMLPPTEFGNYFATGMKKRTRGQAIFFQVNPAFSSNYFPLTDIHERCQPHVDGQPKRTVYLSIYRVLEHLPLSALMNLYLVTSEGAVLELTQQPFVHDERKELHLYQELCPVTPRIATSFNALDFGRFVTQPGYPISVPKLIFVELMLNGMATDPFLGHPEDLPYSDVNHLRDCLVEVQLHPEKPTKTVIRYLQQDLLYRAIRNGFFVADQDNFYHYPFPSLQKLETEHQVWWRSACAMEEDRQAFNL
jgi:hypothetical protein